MDVKIPSMYREYGLYSNWRNLPSELDGLKPVERRVLYSAYKIAKKFVKSRQVDAYTIGHFHPHGEVYGTIVHLVRQGFLDGQGNFGSNVGVDVIGPAAPRYTECRISQKSLDLFFKYIDYVPFVDTELGDKEPEYLPVMFPVCLIGKEYSQGIGFGYKTFIPCYTEKDLFKRLEYLLGIRKRKPTIYPITNCEITSSKETLEQLLTKGKARINVSGIIKINSAKNTVSLLSWPPGKRFQNLLNKFTTELNENMIGFTDLSTSETHVLFQVLRERNRDKIFQNFVDKLTEAVKGAISFEIVVSCKNGVSLKSVDDMLLETFTRFVSVTNRMLGSKKTALLNRVNELVLLEKIRKPLSDCISKKLDYSETVKEVSVCTSVPKNVISELVDKYKIKKLLSLSIDTETLQHEISEVSKQLHDVRSFVLEKYQEILNI